MSNTSRFARASVAVLLASTATVLLGGCSWFSKGPKGDYALAAEERPLEVPPDLNLPDTSSAAAVPADDEVILLAGAVLAPVSAVTVEVVDVPVAAAVVAGRCWLLAVLSIGNRARRTRRYSATPGRRAWCALGLFHG